MEGGSPAGQLGIRLSDLFSLDQLQQTIPEAAKRLSGIAKSACVQDRSRISAAPRLGAG